PGEPGVHGGVEDHAVGVLRVAGGVRGAEVGAVGQAEDGDLLAAEGVADPLPVLDGVVGGQGRGVAGVVGLAGGADEAALVGEGVDGAHREDLLGAVHTGGAGQATRLDGDALPLVDDAGGPGGVLPGTDVGVGVAARATRVGEQGAARGAGGG